MTHHICTEEQKRCDVADLSWSHGGGSREENIKDAYYCVEFFWLEE